MRKRERLIVAMLMVISINGYVVLAHADFERALSLVEEGAYQKAAVELESLLKTNPEQKNEIHHVAAYCYQKQRKWPEAIKHYLRITPQKGSSNKATAYDLADYVVYHLAGAYKQTKDYTNAALWYQRLVEEYPQSPHHYDAKYALAGTYQASEYHAKALQCYADLVANPKSGYVRKSLLDSAASHEALGNWQEAHHIYQQLIDNSAEDQIAFDALEHIQRLARAHKSLQITRDQRMAHGMALYNRGKHDSARTEFRAVAAGYADELTGRAIYHVGRSYFSQREYTRAIQAYDEVISRYPASGYLTRALYQKTICLRRKGQSQVAEAALRKFVEAYAWSALADDALNDLARMQEDQGLYDKAIQTYALLTQNYRKSELVPEAYWRTGWMQFKAKHYGDSVEAFRALITLFPNGTYTEAAHFWMGKSYERKGDHEAAARVYAEIVEANHWYYSSRAKERLRDYAALGSAGVDARVLEKPRARALTKSPAWANIGAAKAPRVAKLMQLRLFEDATTELRHNVQTDRANLRDDYYNLIVCYQRQGKYQDAHTYADRLSKFQSLRDDSQAIPLELYQLLYPVYYNDTIGKHSRDFAIDPLFVASMIREESRYNADIVSWAGARGLMQIMPSTGKDLAQRLNIRRFSGDMLFDPNINIKMGAWYMKDLMNQFENNHALVAGAYNGGPGRMQRWVASKGVADLDEFIEDIPITETRRHIKKVLDSYYIYQELYGGRQEESTEKM